LSVGTFTEYAKRGQGTSTRFTHERRAKMSARQRNILIMLGLLLLVAAAYLTGRVAFPELWPWF
jgi:type II secretory pathway component PulM